MSDVVGNEDVLGRLVMRARALIDNAGDGDWNRESAEWQLAAAKWRRDLEDVGAVPEPFVLEPDIGVEAAVMRTIGAASTCWTEIRNAGVFDSGRAEQIGATFLGWLSDWIRTREPSEQDTEVTQRVTSDVVRYAESTGGYRDDVIQTAGHVWQEELDEEQAVPVRETQEPPRRVRADHILAGTRSNPERGRVVDTREWTEKYYCCDHCQYEGQYEVDRDPEGVAEVCPVCSARYSPGSGTPLEDEPAHEAQQSQGTPPGLDLGDDPDGDIEGYDGPLGRPGGYCHGSEPWHPYGTVTGCCAFGGREAAPEPEGGPVPSFWPETPGSTP